MLVDVRELRWENSYRSIDTIQGTKDRKVIPNERFRIELRIRTLYTMDSSEQLTTDNAKRLWLM